MSLAFCLMSSMVSSVRTPGCWGALLAASAPGAEVVVVDGLSGEVFGEDGTDLRQVVEPGEDFPGGLAVGEASVQFLAEVVREESDGLFHSHAFQQ
jgi:hypothetical protein